jgi:ankyrin repeat protein
MPFELHRETKRGNVERVRELLRADADLSLADRAGYTPLMYALERPEAPVELVQLLLDHGARADDSRTLLDMPRSMTAICLRGGNPQKLALLLERGADLHYTSHHDYYALLDAVFGQNIERNPDLPALLRMLIERGVPLNGVSSYQESALRVLSHVGRFDAVQLLLDAGADEAQLAWTPLHRAVALETLAEVQALVEAGADLDALDYWERTPWLVAVKTGDLDKARYLLDRGSDFTVTARAGQSPLDLAIESFHTPMLQWLIELGIGVESSDDCCSPPLRVAVDAGNLEAVDILIASGADVDRRTACGSALGSVRDRAIALRLLDAGADPQQLSFEGRRAILGLEPEPDESLFDATPEDFQQAPTACWGDTNPEKMDQPFWQAMIRSGITAYAGSRLCGRPEEDLPVWCAQRFGQSITFLPDGRIVQIGGEHEDFYDSDFCIYNDVFVHHPDGRIEIFCYPEEVFPPTDFHTATLVGDSIYILGGLGYQGQRRFGETPVYRLDTNTLKIHPMETSGRAPGWISRHRAKIDGPTQIRIWGGKLAAQEGDKESYADQEGTYILNVVSGEWR